MGAGGIELDAKKGEFSLNSRKFDAAITSLGRSSSR